MVAVDKASRDAVTKMKDVILEEINVKDLVVLEDDSEIVNKSAKPNFKSIGPKFGKKANPVANAIRGFGKDEIIKLEKGGSVTVVLDGEEIAITAADVEIVSTEIQGWLVESEEGVTVALDTELNDELLSEGLAREFVNRVQNMRKDTGLEVTDKITISFKSEEGLRKAVLSFSDYIVSETLAGSLSSDAELKDGYSQDWEVGEYKCSISIKKMEA
ncbi:MAG TPA: DUF5915 domain-containing protein [Ignavibacteriales bacterium]|nr:DUF5915 domain-containing protein [Ignavibacteriales bacterium]